MSYVSPFWIVCCLTTYDYISPLIMQNKLSNQFVFLFLKWSQHLDDDYDVVCISSECSHCPVKNVQQLFPTVAVVGKNYFASFDFILSHFNSFVEPV